MHTLYTGVTLSGKTTLARMEARGLHAKGQRGIVYDPMGTDTKGGGWGFPEVHHDREAFLRRLESDDLQGPVHVFVDEAHKIFRHDMEENFWLLTDGRHHGYFMHLITQRPNKVHPDVRSQCGICFMFRLAQQDAREIGADYGFSDLHRISLDKGDFLVLQSGTSAISRGNVFTRIP